MRNCFVPTKRIQNDLGNFFNDFGFTFMPAFNSESTYSPRVNIVDSKNSVDLTFELPGLEKGDIKVLVKDGVLTVSGDRKLKNEVKEDNYIRTEISSGSFSRSFTLGENIDTDKVTADYKNGLLEVKLAKKEEAKPKEVEIKIS